MQAVGCKYKEILKQQNKEILKTAKKYGQTIVMITHDDEIAQVADRILVIEDGQVVDFR